MKTTALRLAVGGVAVLSLLLPGVAPSWAAEPDGIASGVVRLDGKPRAGIKVCDMFDETDCVISGPGGVYSVTPRVKRLTMAQMTKDWQCLAVIGTHVYESVDWAPNGMGCSLPADVAPGSRITVNIDVASFPIARGRVINKAGKAIAGASVTSYPNYDARTSFTDKNGRFAVPLGTHGHGWSNLVIKAKGYRMATAESPSKGDLGPIVLAKAGSSVDYSVSGRVLDAKGRPYLGVKVCLAEGPCLGKVHSNGYFYGLIRFKDLKNTSVFTLREPGSSSTAKRTWELYIPGASFAVKRTFRLKTSRRIVVAKPKIIGRAKVGQRLKVKAGAWLPKPVTLRCVWYVGSKRVQTGCSSLQVKSAYRGKKITVKVIGSRTGYATKKATSRATVRVYR